MEQHRPESGPMEFPNDWPGIFIRGDHAQMYMLALQKVVKDPPAEGTPITAGEAMELIVNETLRNLMETLASCDTRLNPITQKAELIGQPASFEPGT